MFTVIVVPIGIAGKMSLVFLLLPILCVVLGLFLIATFGWGFSIFSRRISRRESFWYVPCIAILVLCLFFVYRDPNIISAKLVWDLSESRNSAQLSQGNWLQSDSNTYQVNGSRSLALGIRLSSDKHFDFSSVRRVTVRKVGSEIEIIRISSYGYSKEEALSELQTMHEQWQGQGVNDVSEWISATDKGSLQAFGSTIRSPQHPNEPKISSDIRYNFGSKDSEWFILTTFFWPNLTLDNSDEVVPKTVSEESLEQVEYETVAE